ncbi:MAG: hypothetical protein LBC43_04715 [Bifidobacteriaceae bacterium]|jgi:cysteine sulfinate desulfinase/cysteine desulfurase-like protein|nr:hypothetical protein [Bifidobacteriaceae bacterium]
MAAKTFKSKINAKGTEITVLSQGTEDDFISLTDIARYKKPKEPNVIVANLESISALYIGKGLSHSDRIEELNRLARQQLMQLLDNSSVKGMKALEDNKTEE